MSEKSESEFCTRNESGQWYAGASDPSTRRIWSLHARVRTPMKYAVAKELADETKGCVVEVIVTERIVYESSVAP